ncbi:hypothetical protein B7486_17555 [cyanobacterium TDX16]|nr:hypothetical protein B7486_17555 [cyanobacterium TDX16]
MTAANTTVANPEHVELLLSRLDELPPLAPVATHILALTQDDKGSIRRLTELVSSDPSLAARVLSACSKAAVAARPESMTIDKAVAMLGFETIRHLTLAQKILEVFSLPQDPAEVGGLDRAEFWRHCLAVACASRRIAQALAPGVNPEEAFVLGLLHDLGKIALDCALPKSFARVLKRSEETRAEFTDVERAVLGVDHTVVGRRLAERWGLPQAIVDVIWLHHHPPEALPEDLAAARYIKVVQLADAMAREHNIGFSGNLGSTLASPKLSALLGLTEAARVGIIESIADELQSRSTWIGQDQSGGREVYLRALLKTSEQLTSVNTRLAEQNRRLQRSARYLAAIDELNRHVTPGLSLRQTAAIGAGAIQAILELRSAVVFVPSPAGSWLELGISDGTTRFRLEQFNEQAADFRVALKNAAELARGGAWILPPDRTLDSLIDRCRPDLGAGTVWLLPILSRNQPIAGVLFVAQADAVTSFRDESAEIAAMSAALGLAIAQAQAQSAAASLAEHLAAANRRLAAIQPDLLRARSLESVAAIVTGAAHELNNPLAVISGRAQLLAKGVDNDETKRDLETIAAQAGLCSEILKDLLSFTQPATVRPESVDIAALLNSIISDMASEGLLDATAMSLDLPPACPVIWFDPEALSVVFRELIDNALEATQPNGRRLSIKAVTDLTEENLVVTFADNGRGMTPDVLARAMDPFFSHRPAGRGRGVGLSRVHRLLEAGGGSIRLESRPGIGTEAQLRLPIRRTQVSDASNAD